MASRDLERGECREVEMRDFRAEVDESKRPRKARWGSIIDGSCQSGRGFGVITIFLIDGHRKIATVKSVFHNNKTIYGWM